MKLARIMTKKLLSFWLLSLSTLAFIITVSVMLSFFDITYNFQKSQVHELEARILEHHRNDHRWDLKQWLPVILKTLKAEEFLLTERGQVVFKYQNGTKHSQSVSYDKTLIAEENVVMTLLLPKPYSFKILSLNEIIILILSFFVLFLMVFFGYRWIKNQLIGVEELAHRSQLILSEQFSQAITSPGNGQPRVINSALTKLLDELSDARKERARFDSFIRTNTFIDSQTGVGNRLFLNNRLDALSYQNAMITPGVIYLLKLEEFESLQQNHGEQFTKQLLKNLIDAINQILNFHPNSIIARKSQNQFAIVVTQISQIEADELANRLLKICLSQPLLKVYEPENFYHLGGAYFKVSDTIEQLIDEAEMALKAAQLQGSSNWFMYDKGIVDEEFAKGSVRWRSILENVLAKRRILAVGQIVTDVDGQITHKEIFSRIKDSQGNIIKPTLFIPMAIKCGLMPQIEQQLIEYVVSKYMIKKPRSRFSINLSLDSLLSKDFTHWLEQFLLAHSEQTPRLIFEISETTMMRHSNEFAHVLAMIKRSGARLCVDHVGQNVISTQYLTEYKIDLIKLDRAITHQLHLRTENQLFIRSLIGGLYRTKVQVLAEGVELLEEWQTLQILGVGGAQGSLFAEPKII